MSHYEVYKIALSCDYEVYKIALMGLRFRKKLCGILRFQTERCVFES